MSISGGMWNNTVVKKQQQTLAYMAACRLKGDNVFSWLTHLAGTVLKWLPVNVTDVGLKLTPRFLSSFWSISAPVVYPNLTTDGSVCLAKVNVYYALVL